MTRVPRWACLGGMLEKLASDFEGIFLDHPALATPEHSPLSNRVPKFDAAPNLVDPLTANIGGGSALRGDP
jgi:hypothetical protein